RTPQPSVPAWQARYREAMSASASTVEPYTLDVPRRPDPYPYYAALRREEPAHYSAVEDIWVLTRFDDCLAAFSDWQTWSSQRQGNLLNDLPERIGRTLGTTDPPRHTAARKLVNAA